jgi:hypothetical protein
MAYPADPYDNEPDILATPEGDNEFPADEPLTPLAAPMERPPGNEPHFSLPFRKALD